MESLISYDRLLVISKLSHFASKLPGMAAELGVYRGGSASVIAKSLPNKKLYLFDTFSGIPFKGDKDVHSVGDFSDISLENIKIGFKNYPNVSFHQGIFPEDTSYVIEKESFCLVHIDADQYKSTYDAIRFFYPRMVSGGYMIFDDYGWPRCPGVKVALDEFFADKNEKIIQEAGNQAYIQKS